MLDGRPYGIVRMFEIALTLELGEDVRWLEFEGIDGGSVGTWVRRPMQNSHIVERFRLKCPSQFGQ